MRFRVVLVTLTLSSLACQTVLGPLLDVPASPAPPLAATATPLPLPTEAPPPTEDAATAPPAPTLEVGVTPGASFNPPQFNANGVRMCAYQPGVSVPAQMPPEVVAQSTPTPFPTPTPPPASAVDQATTDEQLRLFRDLWTVVRDHYVYEDYRGLDWEAVGDKYEAYIRQGLTQADFQAAMGALIFELGDDHSRYLTAEEVAEEEAEQSTGFDFVGIGALVSGIEGTDYKVITSVFPGSAAEAAGLRPHDTILSVDGGPIEDENGQSRTLGPEGTDVTIEVRRPGEAAVTLTITRRRVNSNLPIDYCLVPGTRIGYIYFPGFNDESVDDQTRAALEKMTADGPLSGLILDNRQNSGGLNTVAHPIMEMFAEGFQGQFVSREQRERLVLRPEDINGSQTVPLIVLVDVDTASYGEIASGVLRVAGRARIVGQVTYGNVERLWAYDFDDGSRVWLASETFTPRNEANGVWEDTGIVPDVLVPTRWDMFTEATDPALAKAVEMLLNGK